jgi:nucleoside-diphosphate-sugar epimerase
MRIFLAGASGVIGRRLVPRLVEAGHHVSALTRFPEKTDALKRMGAGPVVCDVLDAESLRDRVVAARPEVVVQHLSNLPQDLNPRNTKRAYAANDRVRGQGSANLVAAAEAAGARRYLAQNVSFLYRPIGPPVLTEDAPLWTDAPEPFGRSVRLHVEMEGRIINNQRMEGLVLRFGFWYGPGTTFAHDGYTARQVRRRRYPIVGDGGGMAQFIHVHDVAEATVAALDHGAPGAYNVTDDHPAPMREWLPQYAWTIGAPPPRRIPAWLARLIGGEFLAMQATAARGASNQKAKHELDWKPTFASWQEGFRAALG